MKPKRAEKTRAMARAVLSAVVLVFLGAVLWPPLAIAQTVRYVDNIGSCEGLTPCYTTIMDAVNAAQSSDIIDVFPAVYQENIVIQGSLVGVRKDNIVLRAHDAALKPVIAPASGDAVSINVAAQVQVLNCVIEGGVRIDSPTSHGWVVQGNRIRGGLAVHTAPGGTVRDNTFVGGGVSGDLNSSRIENNTLVDGGILLVELGERPENNTIQDNVLRRGGIDLNAPASGNTITSNFVSGNTGDGIVVGVALHGSVNVIQGNTSIENGGCDINDRSTGGNTWADNRFGTKCGNATD